MAIERPVSLQTRVEAAARKAGVDPDLYGRLITSGEQSYTGWQTSPKGAFGPAQLMPATARDLAGKYGEDPQTEWGNLVLGARYLKEQIDAFGDEEAALIAYNAGPSNAKKWVDGGRDYALLPKRQETEPYVRRIIGGKRKSGGDDLPWYLGVGSMPGIQGLGIAIAPFMPAAFRQINSIGSAFSAGFDWRRVTADPDFDVVNELKGTRYEQFLPQLLDVDTRSELQSKLARIDMEQADKATLDAAGWRGVAAQLAAGILDPINLVPIGGGAWGVSRMGNVARGAGLLALGSAATAAAQEGALHATQLTRTGEESAWAVGTATVLGGILGGAVGSLARTTGGTLADVARGLDRELAASERAQAPLGAESAGAAATYRTAQAGEENLVGSGGLATAVAKAPIISTPSLRVATGESDVARRTAESLIEPGGLAKVKHASGVTEGPSVEALIKQGQGELYLGLRDMDAAYFAYRGMTGPFKGLRAAAGDLLGSSKMSRQEFNEAVGMAMRRDDSAKDLAIPDAAKPHVEAAAKALRDRVFDPWKERAIKAGLLPEDVEVTTADSYLTRVYNTDMIIARRPEFRQIVVNWLDGLRSSDAAKVAQAADTKGQAEEQLSAAVARAVQELPDQAAYVLEGPALSRQQMQRQMLKALEAEAELPASQLTPAQKKQIGTLGNALRMNRKLDDAQYEALQNLHLDAFGSLPGAAQDLGSQATRAQQALKGGADAKIAEARGLTEQARQLQKQRAEAVRGAEAARKEAEELLGRVMDAGESARAASDVGAVASDTAAEYAAAGKGASSEITAAARRVEKEQAAAERVKRDIAAVSGKLDALGKEIEREMGALMDAPITVDEAGELVDVNPQLARDRGRRIERMLTERKELLDKAEGLTSRLDDAADSVAAARDDLRAAKDAEKAARKEAGTAGSTEAAAAKTEANARGRGKEAADAFKRVSSVMRKAEAAVAKHDNEIADILARRMDAVDKANVLLPLARDFSKSTRKSATLARRAARTMETGGLAKLEDGELDDIADQIIDRILGGNPGRVPYAPIPLSRGPLKERTFNIPDQLIEPFLESDAEKVARIYTRTMAPDVELTDRFGRADLADQIEEIRQEYARKASEAKNETEARRLNDKRDSDIADIAAMRDRLRNAYAIPDNPHGIATRAAAAVRNLNYLRLLGGMTISAVSDLARTTTVHGIMNTVRDGIVPLVTNWRAVRASAEETRLAGTALDMVLDSRHQALYDITDIYSRSSMFERGLDYVSSKFGVATLMAPWNVAVKQFASLVTQARMLRAIERFGAGGKLKPKEVERLARLGIDTDMARRIADQFAKHGETVRGVRLAETAKWDDAQAARAFRAALAAEVDEIIVTPGVGDKPLWTDNLLGSRELGKMVSQFKSFSLASTQRVLIAGLQRRDAAALTGALLMTALGMLSYKLKSDLASRETSDDPVDWIMEGIDRGGMLGSLMEVNNVVEKLTRGNVGIRPAFGTSPPTRYISRNEVGALLGPTADAAQDVLFEIPSSLTGDGWSSADTHRVRKMLPLQNVFYLRNLFDQAESAANEVFGVPEKQQRARK